MSYVGKILVVVQVVLSVLFMAFAGAVFSMHQNWKSKYETEVTTHDQTKKNQSAAQNELELAKSEFNTAKGDLEERNGMLSAQLQTSETQVATLSQEVTRLETLRSAQTGLAEAKASEAKFRQEESAKQRIENEKLRVALDDSNAEIRDLTDKLFTLQTTYDELVASYTKQLEKNAFLNKIVAANGLNTDPDYAAKLQLPPPPVEGVVKRAVQNRANQVELISLSIGSDDGLIVGHELDVLRLAKDQGESTWLGRVVVVSVSPDEAVAMIEVPAKNGIIQVGDIVTSRLGT